VPNVRAIFPEQISSSLDKIPPHVAPLLPDGHHVAAGRGGDSSARIAQGECSLVCKVAAAQSHGRPRGVAAGAANKQRSLSGALEQRSSASRVEDLGRFEGGTPLTSFTDGSCFFNGVGSCFDNIG